MKRQTRRFPSSLALGTLCLAAGLMTGCGGGDDDSLSPQGSGNFVKEGDALVTSRVDVARLAAVVRIAGHLVIRPGEGLEVVNLPRLTSVDGSITVEDLGTRGPAFRVELPALTRVGQNLGAQRSNTTVQFSLPALRTIGGHLAVEKAGKVAVQAETLTSINGDLRVLDGGLGELVLPLLARLGGSLRLDRFGPLPDDPAAPTTKPYLLSLPALAIIEGDVKLRSVLELQVDAPLLARIAGDVQISGLRVGLQLPALEEVAGDLRITQAVLLPSQLEALREVGGDLVGMGLTLEPAGPLALTGLTRVGGSFTLEEIGKLRELTLPALAEVGAPMLLQEVGGLRELVLPALVRVGGRARFLRNGDLRRLHIPGPVALTSDLEVSGTGSTLNVTIPQVTRLGGSLRFVDDGDLSVALPLLAEVVGTVRVERTTLRALDLQALVTVGQAVELEALSSNVLEQLELPALRTIGGNLELARSQILRGLILPALDRVGGVYDGHPRGSLLVTENLALGALSMPLLRQVVLDLVIRGNPLLDANRLSPGAGAVVGGKREICGNLGALPACL